MISWDTDLVEDIARRRCVLFLGAGVSRNSTNDKGERPADWISFLKLANKDVQAQDPAAATEVSECISRMDLLTACEICRKAMKPDRFKTLMMREFHDKGFKPARIHQDIARIDSRYVITTNFDRLYESAANLLLDNTVLVKNYYDAGIADILRRTQRVLLKIHGSVDETEKTVFSRSDYARARTDHAHFYQVFEAMLLTHTFVFLGASMSDPDIQIILENHSHRFRGSRPHFLVTPSDGVLPGVRSVMEESMNLRPVLYDPTNHHSHLSDGVADLVSKVADARAALVDTQNW